MLLAVRSVPLSQETRTAWADAQVKIARRNRTEDQVADLAGRLGVEAVLNLGNLDFKFNRMPVPVFNEPISIRFVSHPAALRKNMHNFIPPQDSSGAHWHKKGGYGGRGTEFHKESCNVNTGMVQKHIEGTEYRVITVGTRIVQAHKKTNERWVAGLHQFDWDWVGVDGIRKNGIIPHVKAGLGLIPHVERTLFGWDIIVANKNEPYTIEINTSPGVNDLTAARIVRGVRLALGKDVR